MAPRNKCIVSLFPHAGTNFYELHIDDNRYGGFYISSAGCLKNPNKTFCFLGNLLKEVQPTDIKALLMTFPVMTPLKITQAIKKKIKKFCEKNGITCCFPSKIDLTYLAMICAAKPEMNDGENIILICVSEIFVNVRVYQRSQNEYLRIAGWGFKLRPDDPLTAIKKYIVKDFNPKKIVLLNTSVCNGNYTRFTLLDGFNQIAEALAEFDVFTIKNRLGLQSAAETLIKHLMDEEVTEYMVKFVCDREMNVSSLIKCGFNDSLPLEKSFVYQVKNDVSLKLTEHDNSEIQTIDLSKYQFQQVKITLKIDENMFYDLKVVPIGPANKPTVVEPLKQVEEPGPKAKLVISQNYCMIFACKDGKLELIKDFSGKTEIPFCISFAVEIPAIGEKAMNDLKEKSKFVVYDLLKLCQSNILENIDPKWPFKLIKDSETNETLIQFETFRGPRKASADFLFSLILKNSMVLIERETGVKVEEFGIEVSGIDESESIKRCLEKAAERIKLKIAFL